MSLVLRGFSISLVIVLMTGILPARGEGLIDRQGLMLIYGRSNWTNVGPKPAIDYEWTTAAYVLTHDTAPWLSIETRIGAGYLEADNGGDCVSAELRILADIHYKWLFVQFGTGLARIFNAEALPGLAETRVHSILSGAAGLRFPIRAGTTAPVELTLGYGVEHLSAISKNGSEGDTGWNAGGPRMAVTWRF